MSAPDMCASCRYRPVPSDRSVCEKCYPRGTPLLPPTAFPGVLAGVVCCPGRMCGRIYPDADPKCPGCGAANPLVAVASPEPDTIFPHPDCRE